jgi:hypothetical protein
VTPAPLTETTRPGPIEWTSSSAAGKITCWRRLVSNETDGSWLATGHANVGSVLVAGEQACASSTALSEAKINAITIMIGRKTRTMAPPPS